MINQALGLREIRPRAERFRTRTTGSPSRTRTYDPLVNSPARKLPNNAGCERAKRRLREEAAGLKRPAAVRGLLRGNPIGPLAILALNRGKLQAHSAFHGSAQKTTNRVRLPSGCLLQFGQGGAARPSQQAQDLSRFSPWPGSR